MFCIKFKHKDINMFANRKMINAAKSIASKLGLKPMDSNTSKDLKTKFSEVYDKNLFEGRKSRSGEGSDHIQTAIIRQEIPRVIKKYNVKTFLDAPCGDWY